MNADSVKWPAVYLDDSHHLITDEEPDWQHNVILIDQQSASWGDGRYENGFRAAARGLVEDVVSSTHKDLYLDVAVYPIAFLYRHHIELLMKQLIAMLRWKEGMQGNPPATHNLLNLWNTAEPLLTEQFNDESIDWTQNAHVRRLLTEWSKIDPNGTAGRYLRDKDGEIHWSGTYRFNLRHFAEIVERLSAYLTEISIGVDYTLRQMIDYDTEMRLMYENEYFGE